MLMKFFKRIVSLATGMLLLFMPLCHCVASASEEGTLTLLFTSDIHSNIVPHTASIDGKSVMLGGFARLKTAIDENLVKNHTLLLDSGDFSMGTMYQSFSQSDALELRLLEKIGYDAVALGNHDFELTEAGLRQELSLIQNDGAKMRVLCSNLTDASGKAGTGQSDNPLHAQGVDNYTVIERGGVRIGIFALMGEEAIQYTPTETMRFSDPVQCAKATVKNLREKEGCELVVLLSHCGTIPGSTFQEDDDLAKAVDGIDVIISGHSHIFLSQAERINDTIIVGAGTALTHLGKLRLHKENGAWRMDEYTLLPLSSAYADDPSVSAYIKPFSQKLADAFHSQYGIKNDLLSPFAVSEVDFPSGDTMSCAIQNYTSARLLGDAYLDALDSLGAQRVQLAAIPVGTIRGGIYMGNLSVTDCYNMLSYGTSPIDGSSGAPLCVVYLNGSELYDICEASISLSPIISGVQILFTVFPIPTAHIVPF